MEGSEILRRDEWNLKRKGRNKNFQLLFIIELSRDFMFCDSLSSQLVRLRNASKSARHVPPQRFFIPSSKRFQQGDPRPTRNSFCGLGYVHYRSKVSHS